MKDTKNCQNCELELEHISHYEYDGGNGSYEPYYQCPDGCAYPESTDEELTPGELKERGKVNTMTEHGIVEITDTNESIIL